MSTTTRRLGESQDTCYKGWVEALRTRRSHYALKYEADVDEAAVQKVIEDALFLIPSFFNSQTTRIVLLLNQDHLHLWSAFPEILDHHVLQIEGHHIPAATRTKLEAFGKGNGTVLFFEDTTAIERLKENPTFLKFASSFTSWSEQSNALHQLHVWVGLSSMGLGASLQHFNPVIDETIYDTWKIDRSWKLVAQMPFGAAIDLPPAKPKLSLEERRFVFGQRQ